MRNPFYPPMLSGVFGRCAKGRWRRSLQQPYPGSHGAGGGHQVGHASMGRIQRIDQNRGV